MTAPTSQALPGPEITGNGDTAVLRGVGACVAYTILSGGLWSFAWIYHTAKEVTPRTGREAHAGQRVFGWLIPIVNWFVLYKSWRDVDEYARRAGTSGFTVALYLVFSIIFPIVNLALYPMVQAKLNDAHLAATGGAATKAPLQTADWITIGLGLLSWIAGIAVVAIAIANN